MTALRHPFGGTSFLALVMSILKDSPQPLPNSYSQELISIITSMLVKDMKLRPSAQMILKLEYFAEKENLKSENYSDEYNNELDYEVSDSSSSKSDEVMYGSRADNLGISGINPLELVNTQLYDSVSTVTEYELSNTIPTFTPDIQVTETNFFKSTKKQETIKVTCKGNEEDEYEDDFESVYII
jgi:serine/threonine protein kinase